MGIRTDTWRADGVLLSATELKMMSPPRLCQPLCTTLITARETGTGWGALFYASVLYEKNSLIRILFQAQNGELSHGMNPVLGLSPNH